MPFSHEEFKGAINKYNTLFISGPGCISWKHLKSAVKNKKCFNNFVNITNVSQIRYSLVVILELSGVSEVQYKKVMMIDDGKYQ